MAAAVPKLLRGPSPFPPEAIDGRSDHVSRSPLPGAVGAERRYAANCSSLNPVSDQSRG